MLQNSGYIKTANLEDLEAINHLLYLSKAFWGYDTDFMKKFMREHSVTVDYMKSNPVYLYYIQDKLVAFYSFFLNNEILELEYFFIHPDYIGKGVGSKLWNHCCKTAKSIYNKYRFILWSDPNTERFYIKMGCKIIGSRQSTLLPNRFAPILEYTINETIDSQNYQVLPDKFKEQIINTFGGTGEQWLQKIPDIINYAIGKWQLENISLINNLSYNYIAYGYSKTYQESIVLKIVCDNDEFNRERMCLLDFQGYGINRLLDSDTQYNILLLEKIGNGITLKSLFPNNENEAIEYVANIIKQLHETKRESNKTNYPTVLEWVKSIEQCNYKQIDAEFLKLGRQLVDELLYSDKYENRSECLLHGDLHHENILQSDDGNWISIDPKGIIGHSAYEIGAFMRNPVPELIRHPNLESILINRIDRFSESLELDKQLLIKYSYLSTLLAIIWNLEDNGSHWQDWIQLLPIFRDML